VTLTRGYAAVVAVLAAIGVIGQTPWPLLAAVALTLPVGGAALVLYYLAYGLIVTATHAGPIASISYSAVRADGTIATVAVDGRPTWFTVVSGVLAVALFTAVAIGNAALIRWIRRSRAVTR